MKDIKKAVEDALLLINEKKPKDLSRWGDLIEKLENTKFTIKGPKEPAKKFSMAYGPRGIRLANTFLSWTPYPEAQASNILHEGVHLWQFDNHGWPKRLAFYFSYMQKNGRYFKELGAIKNNVRWWCRLGRIGTRHSYGGRTLNYAAESYIDRVIEHFPKNYWMGDYLNDIQKRWDMKRVLTKYVHDAINEGYRP